MPLPPPPTPSENISDGGLTVLVDACPALRVLWLSGKLLKVTDATLDALTAPQRACRAARAVALERVKLTRSMTAAALRRLAGCRELVEIDARHVRDAIGAPLLSALARGCPKLSRVALPLGPAGDEDGGSSGGGGDQQVGSYGSSAGGFASNPLADVLGGGGSYNNHNNPSLTASEEEEEDEVMNGGGLGPGCSLSGARGARMLLEGDVRRFALGAEAGGGALAGPCH
jgi:hypothetical protein